MCEFAGRPSNRAGSLWTNAVQMCHAFYLERDNIKALPEELVHELLTADAMADCRVVHSAAYYWSRLAEAFLEQFPHREWDLFKRVLRVASRGWTVLEDLDTHEPRVVSTLLRKDPRRAWQCIAQVYRECREREDSLPQYWLAEGGHRTIGDECPGPIQYVPCEVLFDWVDQNVQEHGYWLTRVLPKTLDASEAGRLTRDFVARYGKERSIRSGLYAHFVSRGYGGNASDHYRKLREAAREWLKDGKNGTVVGWIEEYIDGLSYEIERAEIDEERRF